MDIQTFTEDFHLNIAVDTPIYEQLYTYFSHKIQTGELAPGEKLITEGEICDALSISRTTVRHAMDRLVREGLVNRQRRRGTFVSETKIQRPINYLYNFTDNILELGMRPSSRILACDVVFVNDEVRRKLSLPLTQDKVFHLLRIRLADDCPMLVEDTYIPYYLCNGIQKIDFSTESLYQRLKDDYGLDPYHATESIEAVIISNEEAKLLDCDPKIAGYRIERVSHDSAGYAFEYTTSITRADRCVFRLELYNDRDAAAKSFRFQRSISV